MSDAASRIAKAEALLNLGEAPSAADGEARNAVRSAAEILRGVVLEAKRKAPQSPPKHWHSPQELDSAFKRAEECGYARGDHDGYVRAQKECASAKADVPASKSDSRQISPVIEFERTSLEMSEELHNSTKSTIRLETMLCINLRGAAQITLSARFAEIKCHRNGRLIQLRRLMLVHPSESDSESEKLGRCAEKIVNEYGCRIKLVAREDAMAYEFIGAGVDYSIRIESASMSPIVTSGTLMPKASPYRCVKATWTLQ